MLLIWKRLKVSWKKKKMKVYKIKYVGITLGFLLMPSDFVENEYTQQWFKEFSNTSPIEARELDPNLLFIGNKSLQEIELEEQEENKNESNHTM